MSQLPEKVLNYLNKRAELSRTLNWNHRKGICNAIVIPALAEYENLKVALLSLALNSKHFLDNTLVIVVVNNKASEKNEYKIDNQKTLEFLQIIIDNRLSEDSVADKIITSGLQIGFIDASTAGSETDEKTGGVGLARKIGMDEALKIFDYTVPDKKIIICLDADCTVDNNYIESVANSFNKFNMSAGTIQFTHNPEKVINNAEAIISYELFLRYYVLGLRYANSPYAFHTIGSSMVCDYEAYINIEGMNKKIAAEDFYFLQKLSKKIPIYKLHNTTVYPSSRKSDRVPFGTGRTMTDFTSKQKTNYLLYNIESFKILKNWLEVFNSDLSLNISSLMIETKNIDEELYNFLMMNDFEIQWKRILESCKSETQLNYQRRNWFDAFKTLKLMHHLRDNTFKLQNSFEAINSLLILFNEPVIDFIYKGAIPTKAIQMEYLNNLIRLEKSRLEFVITNENVSEAV